MFDQPPPGWIIRIAFRQCPDHVNVIRHDHMGINAKRAVFHHNDKRPPQIIDFLINIGRRSKVTTVKKYVPPSTR